MGFFALFPITSALLAANLALSWYALAVPGALDRLAFDMGRILHHNEKYRMVTSAFIHADLFHLLFNMIALYSFGPLLESRLGIVGYLVLYFGSLAASDWFVLQMKRDQLAYRAVGASGAISGVIFAFILFAPLSKIYVFFIPVGIPAFVVGGIFLAVSLYFMDGGPNGKNDSLIGHEAHLAGAVAGTLITGIIAPDSVRIFLSYFV